MKKHFDYLAYVLRHKWFVFLACLKYGEPLLIWRGLIHDWHKFLPSEWGPYVDNFYGNYPLYKDIGNYQRTYYGDKWTKEWVDRRFDVAWLLHQHRGPHHWQHWILREDSGGVKCIEMPRAYVLEMVADWRGAGRAITGKDETEAWYKDNWKNMILHPNTREQVEKLLGLEWI